MSSAVMDAGDGVYTVSGSAQVGVGGSARASDLAHKEAQKFCAGKGALHPIVIDNREQDTGGTGASGSVNIRFRCEP